MKKDKEARVYQFDPGKKKKLKSVDYVSPEKKELLRDRKRARKDRKNFYIGVAVTLLVVAALTFIRLVFW
ncbi:MAG: hypothetical protein ACYC4H_02710 [Desulfocucumaceae bacterium]